MPPAAWLAVLPLTVELVSVNMLLLSAVEMPAAVGAELQLMVQPESVAVPMVARPPPCWLAVLPLKVEFVIVVELPAPPLYSPAPILAVLPLTVQLASVTAP